jgi:type I restriction enzyme S subunit
MPGGSIIQHWRPDELKQVLIPILPPETQKEISKQIQKSFALPKQSVQLLETAKQAVEIAIEQGEKKAIEFVKKHSLV